MSNDDELPARDMFGARPGEKALPLHSFGGRCARCGAALLWIRAADGGALALEEATIEERAGGRFALVHSNDCELAKEETP